MSNSFSSNITRLCELGFQAYARSIGFGAIPSASILAGFDDADVMTPRLVFNCDTGEPEANFDELVWSCQLEVQVVSNCDKTTKEQHHDFASEVFSQFMTGRYTLPDAITTAAQSAGVNFFCQNILAAQQIKTIQDRKWVSSLILKVSCCGTGSVSSSPPTEPTEPPQLAARLDEGGSASLDEGGSVQIEE